MAVPEPGTGIGALKVSYDSLTAARGGPQRPGGSRVRNPIGEGLVCGQVVRVDRFRVESARPGPLKGLERLLRLFHLELGNGQMEVAKCRPRLADGVVQVGDRPVVLAGRDQDAGTGVEHLPRGPV